MRLSFLKAGGKGKAIEHVTKYDAHAYAIAVAAGIPLMAWLVPDIHAKLIIACVWFALAPAVYFWLEGMEIVHQMLKYGVLDQQESDYQRRTMYDLYYGVIFAVVVWLIVYVAYVASHGSEYSGFWQLILFAVRSIPDAPLHYGIIEWAILVQTVLVGRWAIQVFYSLITAFLQATAGQKRYETEAGGAGH